MIPGFDKDGNLPPGEHECLWDEFAARFGQTAHRRQLLAGLKAALDSLKGAGCTRAYVDGSFVTAKDAPGDFDGCWEVTGVDPTRLDPILLTFGSGRLAQKIKYKGEMFPAQCVADGVSGRMFLEFFQIAKDTGKAKGIIALDLRRLP
jgi:hypothetical protein